MAPHLGYALTRHFRLLATVGVRKNDYDSAPAAADNRDDLSGVPDLPGRRRAAPTSRLALARAIFGAPIAFGFRVTVPANTVWTASYDEDVNDISQQLLNDAATVCLELCGGQFVGDGVLPPAEPDELRVSRVQHPGTGPIWPRKWPVCLSKILRGGGVLDQGKRPVWGASCSISRRHIPAARGRPRIADPGHQPTSVNTACNRSPL